jgi:hypothetical protein
MVRARRILAMAAASAVGLAGCGVGLGPGRGTSDVNVTVTRGFGSTEMASVTKTKVPGSETVLRMLERSFHVRTRYGGGFVESIDGHTGDSAHLDWFYFVNGIEAPQGAATTAVHQGDRVWWDLHDWSATDSVPAVVGSYPEPFVRGINGKRFPTTVECATDVATACKQASAALDAVRVPVASQLLGTGSGQDTLGVLVGTWYDIKGTLAGSLIEQGPKASGVYAKFGGPGERSLELLNPAGEVVRTLTGDAGLIAATAQGTSTPTWLITGTDPAGVAAAAAAMTSARLRNHFAVAVTGAIDLPIPLEGGS